MHKKLYYDVISDIFLSLNPRFIHRMSENFQLKGWLFCNWVVLIPQGRKRIRNYLRLEIFKRGKFSALQKSSRDEDTSQFHVNLLSYGGEGNEKLHTMEMKNRSSAYERCEETMEGLFMRNSRQKLFRWKLKTLAVFELREWNGEKRKKICGAIELARQLGRKLNLNWNFLQGILMTEGNILRYI